MNSIAVEHSIMSCSEAIHVGWFPGNQFVQATKVTQNKKECQREREEVRDGEPGHVL